MKGQAHNSLEPPLEYNQHQTTTILRVIEILCSLRLVLKGKAGKEIPKSSRLEFLEKFLVNNFALSEAEDNSSGPLNRGVIRDLSLLRTLLAIRQKSQEPSFCEMMGSFILVAYPSACGPKLSGLHSFDNMAIIH